MPYFIPARVYFEPQALDYPLGQKLFSYFRAGKTPITMTTSHNRVTGIPGATAREAFDDVVCVQEALEPEDHVDDDVAEHQRDGDAHQLLGLGRSVDIGRFIHLAGDREDAGDVDEQRTGDRLPRRDDDDCQPCPVGLGEDALLEPRDSRDGPERGY